MSHVYDESWRRGPKWGAPDYYEPGTCALCQTGSLHLVDSRWGRVHEDCGAERAEEERTEAHKAALRAEGRAEAVTAIVATLRERAEALRAQARTYDEAELPPLWAHGASSAAGELERTAEAIEQSLAATKEGT